MYVKNQALDISICKSQRESWRSRYYKKENVWEEQKEEMKREKEGGGGGGRRGRKGREGKDSR